MNVLAIFSKINKLDMQWSKIKRENPEMNGRFLVYLKNDHGQQISLIFDYWRLEAVGMPTNTNTEHSFRIGHHIDQINQTAYLTGWEVSQY